MHIAACDANNNHGVRFSKADSYFSFFGNGKITCGESRGKVDVISLIECVDDVTYHLKSCHLSRVKVTINFGKGGEFSSISR